MRIWTRTFVLATVVNFLVSLVFFMLMVTMATYAGERFSASDSVAGLAASIFIVGALVVRPRGVVVRWRPSCQVNSAVLSGLSLTVRRC